MVINDLLIKKVFYQIVNDAQLGLTLNPSKDEFSYVRFNYLEEGKVFGNQREEELFGKDDKIDEEYEAEYSNGTVNYLPTLIVNNKEEFFETLKLIINKYLNFYDFNRAFKQFGEEEIIKSIIIALFSNARYVDYENPIDFMNKYMDFFDEYTINNTISIPVLGDSQIKTNTKKDIFGYETPYYYESYIEKDNNRYYLPNINYGISDNICYIYAIQNKYKNEENDYTKKIKRLLNKVNANVINDTDYNEKETILGVPPSFVLALSIFLKELNNRGINNIEVITFLPDRYFEKKATEEFDEDLIQKNLTERMILLFYRIKHHINDIEIDYPIANGISPSKMTGENLIIKLNEKIECHNNPLLEELFNQINTNSKKI